MHVIYRLLVMYLFSFKTFPGFEKKDQLDRAVFSFDRVFYSSQNIGKAGDLLYWDEDILLHL